MSCKSICQKYWQINTAIYVKNNRNIWFLQKISSIFAKKWSISPKNHNIDPCIANASEAQEAWYLE
jgi:hypothetical protein